MVPDKNNGDAFKDLTQGATGCLLAMIGYCVLAEFCSFWMDFFRTVGVAARDINRALEEKKKQRINENRGQEERERTEGGNCNQDNHVVGTPADAFNKITIDANKNTFVNSVVDTNSLYDG
jgi:hypothetical protein